MTNPKDGTELYKEVETLLKSLQECFPTECRETLARLKEALSKYDELRGKEEMSILSQRKKLKVLYPKRSKLPQIKVEDLQPRRKQGSLDKTSLTGSSSLEVDSTYEYLSN